MKKDHRVIYTLDDVADNVECYSIGCSAIVPRGDVYTAFGRVTSVVGKGIVRYDDGTVYEGSITIKSAKSFDGSIDLAYECLAHWKALGYGGAPSSPASFMRNAFREFKRGVLDTRCFASANFFRSYLQGGWIESMYRGYVECPVYHYDVNRAYASVAIAGLPSRLYPYQKRMCGFIALCENVKGDNLPSPLTGKRCVLTNEDIDAFSIRSFDIIYGVSFKDCDVILNDILYTLAGLPSRAFKMLQQSYWGVFAMRNPIDVSYRNGNSRLMTNYNQNICWAQLIIRRVMHKVYRQAVVCKAFSVFVDSILCTEEMDNGLIGDDPGQWKLEGVYDRGVYIESAGLWNPLPFNPRGSNRARWKRHAGIPSQLT